MSKQQFTPGPWVIEERSPYQGASDLAGAVIATPDQVIAEVRGAVRIVGNTHVEHLANARLIAAAPELLEALRPFAELKDRGAPALRPLIKDARAAIAKATGETA